MIIFSQLNQILISSTFQIYQHQKFNQTKSTMYLFFNSIQQVDFQMRSFRFVYKQTNTYFIHNKWLWNIPYYISLLYFFNVIAYKTFYILSIFDKRRSSYFPSK